ATAAGHGQRVQAAVEIGTLKGGNDSRVVARPRQRERGGEVALEEQLQVAGARLAALPRPPRRLRPAEGNILRQGRGGVRPCGVRLQLVAVARHAMHHKDYLSNQKRHFSSEGAGRKKLPERTHKL